MLSYIALLSFTLLLHLLIPSSVQGVERAEAGKGRHVTAGTRRSQIGSEHHMMLLKCIFPSGPVMLKQNTITILGSQHTWLKALLQNEERSPQKSCSITAKHESSQKKKAYVWWLMIWTCKVHMKFICGLQHIITIYNCAKSSKKCKPKVICLSLTSATN